MEIVVLILAVVLGWLALALALALVIGRAVRRGDEDARILGSVVVTATQGLRSA